MRLGLIAMSGTRASDSDLTAFGLTLPGFVERGKLVAQLPSLGLLTLAAMTPREIDVEYFEIPDLAVLGEPPDRFDAVAISSFTAQITDAYRVADWYRARGVKVILGGLHVTARPDEALRHADAVVIGEGEPVWPLVVSDLEHDRLWARYDTRDTPFDFAEAPIPRYDLLAVEKYNRLTVQTQRGCPLRCEFCASSVRICPRFKVKPVDRVIAEIHRIKEIWPQPFIEFADDNTFANRPHAKRLLRALEPERVRWFTECDVSVADDEELLALMRDSGCAQILIGFESPCADALDGIEQQSNYKRNRAGDYLRAIDRIQRHGITVNGCFVLGLDRTGVDSFDDVLEFVRHSGLYDVQITVLTPFPGTPLYTRLQREGRLIAPEAWDRCTLFDVNFVPDRMTVRDLETGFRGLAARLYSADESRARRRRFFERFERVPSAQCLASS